MLVLLFLLFLVPSNQQRTKRKITSSAHIGNKELDKARIWKVPDKVKQLKQGHVFKIKKKTWIFYLSRNIKSFNEDENRINTRAMEFFFEKPKICSNIFAYSAIDD